MIAQNHPNLTRVVARARLLLSMVAVGSALLIPGSSDAPLLPAVPGDWTIDERVLAAALAHLAYSVTTLLYYEFRLRPAARVQWLTTIADVVFGATLAAVTDGVNSPMYAFFVFAVTATGLTAGLRRTVFVTTASVLLYLSLIVISEPTITRFYVIRPFYLAVIGYLVGFLGQQRILLEQSIQELAVANERQQIARDLHDGRAQALAGINLQLATCQELLRRGDVDGVRSTIHALQDSINQEYDDLRSYMRSLAGLIATPAPRDLASDTEIRLEIDLTAGPKQVDDILQIARESIANVARHAGAKHARVLASQTESGIRVEIDDDGVGIPSESVPWVLQSYAAGMGGRAQVQTKSGAGTHIAITVPNA